MRHSSDKDTRQHMLIEGSINIALLHSSLGSYRGSDFLKDLLQFEGNTMTGIKTGSLLSRGEDPTISKCESLISDDFSVRKP